MRVRGVSASPRRKPTGKSPTPTGRAVGVTKERGVYAQASHLAGLAGLHVALAGHVAGPLTESLPVMRALGIDESLYTIQLSAYREGPGSGRSVDRLRGLMAGHLYSVSARERFTVRRPGQVRFPSGPRVGEASPQATTARPTGSTTRSREACG
jgi:hypothetical protein